MEPENYNKSVKSIFLISVAENVMRNNDFKDWYSFQSNFPSGTDKELVNGASYTAALATFKMASAYESGHSKIKIADFVDVYIAKLLQKIANYDKEKDFVLKTLISNGRINFPKLNAEMLIGTDIEYKTLLSSKKRKWAKIGDQRLQEGIELVKQRVGEHFNIIKYHHPDNLKKIDDGTIKVDCTKIFPNK